MNPSAINLSYVEKSANDFLKEYHPSLSLPIPIEDIAELQLGISLLPIKGIKNLLGVDSFIQSDFKQIVIDEYSFNTLVERTRFSIAHEIGHMILHKKWYEEKGPKNIDEYLKYHIEQDDKEYKYQEIQASTFAGLLLVPTELLVKEVEKKIGRLPDKEALDTIAPFLVDLPGIFQVSDAVILRRLQKEQLVDLGGWQAA